jgi:thioredoxin-related protein
MISRMLLACAVLFFSGNLRAEIMEAGTRDEALLVAEAEGRRVYVLFGGEHCPWCDRQKSVVFAPGMDDALSGFVVLRLDVSKDRDLAKKYGVRSIPVSIVLDADGEVLKKRVGYMDEAKFRDWLR